MKKFQSNTAGIKYRGSKSGFNHWDLVFSTKNDMCSQWPIIPLVTRALSVVRKDYITCSFVMKTRQFVSIRPRKSQTNLVCDTARLGTWTRIFSPLAERYNVYVVTDVLPGVNGGCISMPKCFNTEAVQNKDFFFEIYMNYGTRFRLILITFV